MVQQAITLLIILGALAGVCLGVYGLAPAFFRPRLERLRLLRASVSDDAQWSEEAEPEDYEDAAYGQAYAMLVESPRRGAGLFGLPSAWSGPLAEQPPAYDAGYGEDDEDEDGDEAAFQGTRVTPELIEPRLAVDLPEAPLVAEAAAGEEDAAREVDEVLDIFREVLPNARTRDGRARLAAVESASLRDVRIADLLADARWTARALFGMRREVPGQ